MRDEMDEEQNREVFIVPGSALAERSMGSNWLIHQGAKLVLDVGDILEELNIAGLGAQLGLAAPPPDAGTVESELPKILCAEPVHMDEITRRSGKLSSVVSATLTMLELNGLVRQAGPQRSRASTGISSPTTKKTVRRKLAEAKTNSKDLVVVESPAKALSLVLPSLEGKLDGTAIRVPTPNVSLIDFTFTSKKQTSVEKINKIMIAASKTKELKNILTINDLPLVSIDFNHNSSSSIFDLTQTQVINKRFCRILSWYDNEWGFSNRMIDTLLNLKKLL